MLLKPFIGPLLEIVKRVIPDPAERAKIEAELQTAVIDSEARIYEAQSKVVTAEAQGESWMQRNWRPSLMFFLMFVVAWHILVVPLMALGFGVSLTDVVGLSFVPGDVWTLLSVGMGGYIVGRSGEKIAKTWRGGE